MDLLQDYFPVVLAHLIKSASQIKQLITNYRDGFIVLQDTGELVYKEPGKPYVKFSNCFTSERSSNRIVYVNSFEDVVILLTVDNRVVVMYPIGIYNKHRRLTLHEFDGRNIVQISRDVNDDEGEVMYALTVTGELLMLLLRSQSRKIQVGQVNIVQLVRGVVLNNLGQVYYLPSSIDEDPDEDVKSPVIKILTNSLFVTLDGVHTLTSDKKPWYTNSKYNFVQVEQLGKYQIYLEKNGYLYTGPDEIIPGLTDVVDYIIDREYVITVAGNNKITAVKRVMVPKFILTDVDAIRDKYTFSPNEDSD